MNEESMCAYISPLKCAGRAPRAKKSRWITGQRISTTTLSLRDANARGAWLSKKRSNLSNTLIEKNRSGEWQKIDGCGESFLQRRRPHIVSYNRSSVRDNFKLIFVAATVYVSYGAESDRPSAVPVPERFGTLGRGESKTRHRFILHTRRSQLWRIHPDRPEDF